MKKRLLAVAVIVTFLFGTMSFAKESEPVHDEVLKINAEEIGIREYAIGDDFTDEEDVPDGPDYEEDEYEEDEIESEEVFVDEPDEPEVDREETKDEPVVEAPEGMKEGYISNTFYEPDKHNECSFVHCVTFDEDIGSYVLEKWCEVCGEGTSNVISDEEFELLGVDSDVEF